MNAIRSVFTAFANLAASVNALAAVIDAAAGKLRQNLSLSLDETAAALPHNGEVLDAEGDGTSSSTKRNGRKAMA